MPTTFADGLRAKWQDLTAPLRNATPGQIRRWFCLTCICSLAAVASEVWFYNHYRIAWDRQILKCLDTQFLLVDLKDKTIRRNKIYAYTSAQAAPVIDDGKLVGKYLRGLPGDTVEVRQVDNTIRINGQVVARGMPHLRGMSEDQTRKFYGTRVLGEDEYWMMGTKYLSFDSRYWGPIKSKQLVGRAYELF